jgi:hypothetical protein
MDDALAGHLVDERDSLLEGAFRSGEIVALDGGSNASQSVTKARAILTIPLAVLETLSMCLER